MSRRATGLAPWSPRGKGEAVVEVALELSDEWPLLVRRVLYVAYERGLYPAKTKAAYDSVGGYLGRARRAGLLPWEAIAEVTDREAPYTYSSPDYFQEVVMDMALEYRLDRQYGQPVYLVAWSEHRGLKPVLAGLGQEYGVPIIYSGGFDSITVRHTQARLAGKQDRPTIVLHLGDRDTAGEHIADVLNRDLRDLYRDMGHSGEPPQVVRVALTPEQVVEHGLGEPDESVQIDALPTPVIRGLLEQAILARTDQDKRAEVLKREQQEREQLVDRWSV